MPARLRFDTVLFPRTRAVDTNTSTMPANTPEIGGRMRAVAYSTEKILRFAFVPPKRSPSTERKNTGVSAPYNYHLYTHMCVKNAEVTKGGEKSRQLRGEV